MKLSDWMDRHGYSSRALAESLAPAFIVSASAIRNIRNGRRAPSIEGVAAVERLTRFQVTAADLIPWRK